MAAAEYYNASVPQSAPQQSSPYHQSPHQQPQELYGSPVPQHSLQQGPPPPPYQPLDQDPKPAVHFAPSTPPQRPQRPASGPSSHRPSFSNQPPTSHGQYLKPPSHNSPYQQNVASNTPPQAAMQPPHMRPYMMANQSEYTLGGGYASDPEPRRRRKHRRREHKDDEDLSREAQPRKNRSRSTNADGFLGAAGGGIIGDLIFPGLGTVGGAVAGWIGGKDYGKHRKYREDKLHREQKDWEHKFRDRSNSDDRRRGSEHHHDSKNYPRQKVDYA